ncbi:M28 family peptidase [Maribacter cobaltidurans]|uniref:Vacuolar membrane protease n=1 Tax=Maribacter cobaltidurans TaxID=1178778 RepID=A0A223V4T5_9FLAO|nr:M28 family peptidase [Maribacter cobaltidurans]ASV29859.1 peptidase M28 [Maribacter cobaltidurans]GGD91921.1 aminopeptidase [Maribacter cobaltidurans]
MKKTTSVITLLLLILAVYWSIASLMPTYSPDQDKNETVFSTDRAMTHVEAISKEPHGVGFPGHKKVQSYIASQLEKMGLQTQLQTGYTAGDWANLSKATNILARIKGSGNGKALLLLSHYDSSPHSSYGASDAGSGVAAILEGIRAFLAKNEAPKNDIIILISDAEELGLNGADLFVREHPWAKDVGLVLNFEARGSGGPGIMLLETNRGNYNLIKEFSRANPEYPVANSLAYSIYKLLPNDTDLTVFREKGDIDGFNFAFIDDHFDYHTALDTHDRLDKNTLAHQGSYLSALLDHFSALDLDSIRSLKESVYFNVPFFKMVSYPFEWIWPMLFIGIAFFIALLVLGIRKKVLNGKDILKGFVPMLMALVINGAVGYFSWKALTSIYPGYLDMLHGFTYNGHAYILVFVFFSLSICFYAYHKFQVVKTPNLLIAPLFLWLVICTLLCVYLNGAAFFIIPVYAGLVALYILINQKSPNGFLMLFLGLPAVFILSPFIQLFPIALGLKMMVASTIFATLTFFLLLPLFIRYRNKRGLAFLSFLLFLGFLVSAHMNSDFNKDNPKPTSLLYVWDVDKNESRWATYEKVLSDWTQQYIGADKKRPQDLSENTISSKYGSGFSYISDAPKKNILTPVIEIISDTIIGTKRSIELNVIPQRDVNRLEIFTNNTTISKATVNDIELSDYYLKGRRNGKLVTHYISENDTTKLLLEYPSEGNLELTFYEASNDLLDNPLFSVPKRPEDIIPMPFVLNDAILTIQKMRFE